MTKTATMRVTVQAMDALFQESEAVTNAFLDALNEAGVHIAHQSDPSSDGVVTLYLVGDVEPGGAYAVEFTKSDQAYTGRLVRLEPVA